MLNAVVSEANIGERDIAQWLLQAVQPQLPRLQLIWADAGYQGQQFQDEFHFRTGIHLQVVERPPEQRHFQVQPKRWVIECTFAWLGNARRLAKDYELYFKSSTAMIYAAMTRLMLRQLARFVP